jgi:serine protease AprX
VGFPFPIQRALFGSLVVLALTPVGAAAAAWQGSVRLDEVPGKFRGEGVGIALIDTGVTPSADLGGRLLARVDLTAEGDGIDHYGHGTHMAGLIAGDGTLAGGVAEGAAPDANLVSVKVAGWDGATDVSTVIAGLQWAVSNRDRYGLRVVNLSYGTDGIQEPDRDPLDYAVEQAWRAGLTVVVSAGNDAGRVSKPGDDPFVITVGAADVHDTAAVEDDSVAAFSSSGAGKPDLVAPGVSLVSLRAPGSTVDAFNETARVGDAYFKGSGTSQAAAVVTGVVARMIDANPLLTPDQVKGALLASANGALTGPGAGAGLLDAAAAVSRSNPSRKGKGPGLPIPRANQAAIASSGLGSIAASRGTELVVADLDGDGVPEPVTGEVDALGRPWDAAAYAVGPWSAGSFAATPWALLTSELTPAAIFPALAVAPRIAWEARHWGASGWVAAGWDAESWAARHWGARHWGAAGWQ